MTVEASKLVQTLLGLPKVMLLNTKSAVVALRLSLAHGAQQEGGFEQN
jgi:hypothetical protein